MECPMKCRRCGGSLWWALFKPSNGGGSGFYFMTHIKDLESNAL